MFAIATPIAVFFALHLGIYIVELMRLTGAQTLTEFYLDYIWNPAWGPTMYITPLILSIVIIVMMLIFIYIATRQIRDKKPGMWVNWEGADFEIQQLGLDKFRMLFRKRTDMFQMPESWVKIDANAEAIKNIAEVLVEILAKAEGKDIDFYYNANSLVEEKEKKEQEEEIKGNADK